MKKMVIVFVLLVFLPVCFIYAASNGEQTCNYAYLNIRTEAGDSLWGLAQTYKPDKVSFKNYIKLLKNINGIQEDNIYEGEFLIIPVEDMKGELAKN